MGGSAQSGKLGSSSFPDRGWFTPSERFSWLVLTLCRWRLTLLAPIVSLVLGLRLGGARFLHAFMCEQLGVGFQSLRDVTSWHQTLSVAAIRPLTSRTSMYLQLRWAVVLRAEN